VPAHQLRARTSEPDHLNPPISPSRARLRATERPRGVPVSALLRDRHSSSTRCWAPTTTSRRTHRPASGSPASPPAAFGLSSTTCAPTSPRPKQEVRVADALALTQVRNCGERQRAELHIGRVRRRRRLALRRRAAGRGVGGSLEAVEMIDERQWKSALSVTVMLRSAPRRSPDAFERMIAAASSPEIRAMSVSQTNASMPSVAPMP
jgi:hypothetical protein